MTHTQKLLEKNDSLELFKIAETPHIELDMI